MQSLKTSNETSECNNTVLTRIGNFILFTFSTKIAVKTGTLDFCGFMDLVYGFCLVPVRTSWKSLPL